MPPLRTLLLLLTFASALAQPPVTEVDPERQRRTQKAPPPAELAVARAPLIDSYQTPLNPTPLEAELRLNHVAREVAIRRVLRDAAQGKGEPLSDPEAAQAAVALHQHHAGEKVLSDQGRSAAQARLRQYAENTPQAKKYQDEVTRLEQLVISERLAAPATPPAVVSAPSERTTTPLIPSPEQEARRLQTVAEVVAARRVLREQAAGGKPVPPADLEAARATLRRYGEIYPQYPQPSAEERARQKQAVIKEVAIRRVMREAIAGISAAPADPEVAKAVALIRAEKTGEKPVSPADLKPAYATLRAYSATILPEPKTPTPIMAHADSLEQVAAEVSIRRVLQDALKDASSPPSDPEAAKAALRIRAHELGEQTATQDELAAAHLALRKYAEQFPANDLISHEELMAMAARRQKLADELEAKRQGSKPARTPAFAELRFPDTDMSIVEALCKKMYKAPVVTIADDIKARTLHLILDADSEAEFKTKFQAELGRQGIALTAAPDGSLTLSAVAAK